MKYCYIAPTSLLSSVRAFERLQSGEDYEQAHLLLAHLLDEQGPDFQSNYRDFYRTAEGLKILDNSAFELYKQGRPMFAMDRLIDIGRDINADYIVLSDYPGEPGQHTIDAALELAPAVRQAGFGTFFVPQSEVGDKEDYIETFRWAAKHPLIDYIGVSILGVPNAYGVERDNKLQRYLSRAAMMAELASRGILEDVVRNEKKIHFLGMVDGPKEIELVSKYQIDTWDSSAPVWCGINDIMFDDSPTGLIDGKFEKHVDFSADYDMIEYDQRAELLDVVRYNMRVINELVGKANAKAI